ncbi:hypothetical protein [Methanopyrus sp. KOL6]|uniref:hypothetical protein n=1 Tax=Methanopyrus sp. KOL6 TaxID=1937004 RepID=UPI000B4AF312|nr:hypothetical protein [Methanopyrus sp. KOL6]
MSMSDIETIETPSGERPLLPPKARLTFSRTMPATLPETVEYTVKLYTTELEHVSSNESLRIEEKKDGTNVRVVLGRVLESELGEPVIAHTRSWVRVEEVEEYVQSVLDPSEHSLTIVEGELLPLSLFGISVFELWNETLDYIDYHVRLMSKYTLNPRRKRVPRAWLGKLFDRLSKVRRHVRTLYTIQRRLSDVKLTDDDEFQRLHGEIERLTAIAHDKDYVPADAVEILRDILSVLDDLAAYEPEDSEPVYYVYELDMYDGEITIQKPKTRQYELLSDIIDGDRIKPVPSTLCDLGEAEQVARKLMNRVEEEELEGIVIKPEKEVPGVPHARKVRAEWYLRGMKLDSRLSLKGFAKAAEKYARNEVRRALAAIETSYLYRALKALANGDLQRASRIVREAEEVTDRISEWDDPTV